MKAIISHDIDHITVSEHLFKDTLIPKYLVRMHLELFSGRISSREYTLRWTDLFKNKWQNIDELITFNNVNGIPSSFFIAVNKGIGLSYSKLSALTWIEQMKLRNCEISLQGICFEDLNLVHNEFNLFKSLTKKEQFGVRVRQFTNSEATYNLLAQTGYKYDSSEKAFKNPYRIGKMWEFPFQIMDGWIIEGYKKWQTFNLLQAKENTVKLIDKAFESKLDYIGIDFHDRYFSHSFKTWLDWYMWLVEYLKTNKIDCVNFEGAILELESKKS
ncbi:hypothetical protein [Aurantibacillus circumpalustris]|uniref:hypothetical protein n=1 Tax=Aurantibacillus circumpalustris TaxID=3036359 RepID=UPI00295A65B8|nr:hypothetical protein [Aurantibacillus circumpalustris]